MKYFFLFLFALPGVLTHAQPSAPLFPVEVNGRWGYIDSLGKMAIKPTYFAASAFSEGWAAVRQGGLYGYIDRRGRYTIKPRYDYAGPFHRGFATVWINGQIQLIDRKGTVRVPPQYYRWICADDSCQSGLYIVMTYWNKGASRSPEPEFGLMDTIGHLLLDTVYNHPGRVLAAFQARLDAGEFQGIPPLHKITEEYIPPRYSAFGPGRNKVGLYDRVTGFKLEPIYDAVDFINGFQHGLLAVDQDGRQGYVDRQGRYVWRQPAPSKKLRRLNTDMMQTFIMCVQPLGFMGKTAAPRSDALPNGAFAAQTGQFPGDSLMVHISDEEAVLTTFYFYGGMAAQRSFRGLNLYIINTTGQSAVFNRAGARLAGASLQALDRNGQWRMIEYSRGGGGFCGTGADRPLRLEPGQYWQIVIPNYEGSFKTRLRAVVVAGEPDDSLFAGFSKTRTLVSNEIEVSINPAQFWRYYGMDRFEWPYSW